ncbi:carbohydrate binding family 9 domain-containing protein [Candidatus Latescibacterota bacterium]
MNTTNTQLHRKQCQMNFSALHFDVNRMKRIVSKLFFFTSTLLVLSSAQNALANSNVIVDLGDVPYRVPMVKTPVKVDGVLNEAVWKKAVKVNANIEVLPGENVPAPVDTEVFISYDEDNVYVAFKAYDPEPEKILARVNDRDKIFNDDWVRILFDTFNDNRRSYNFSSNPLGIQADEIESASGGGESWDAIWKSAGKITDEGYVVEMAIPFNAMNIQDVEGDQIWSFDVVRSYPRNYRYEIGAFPRDRDNNCYLCQSIKLIGFEGVKIGRNLEISPTFSSGMSNSRNVLDNNRFGPMKLSDKNNNTGVTAQWGIAKNMVLSAAVNPDFSQVEADAAQMDINTRFPLYYSEQRPFFLENSDFYRVSDLVHTRTLADPEWGVRLTGKNGKNSYGIFTVRDSFTPLMFSGPQGANSTTLSLQSTGTVMRYRRDIGKASNIGLTVTDREGSGYFNRVGHIDGTIKFTQKDQLDFGLGVSNTQYPGEVAAEYNQNDGAFGDILYSTNYAHNTKNYGFSLSSKGSGADFRSDLGFTTRTGYRQNLARVNYIWREDSDSWYNMIEVSTLYLDRRETNGELLTNFSESRLWYQGPLQSYAVFLADFGKTRYNNRNFRNNTTMFFGGVKPTGWLHLNGNGSYGDNIDYSNTRSGTGASIAPSIEIKAGPRMTFDLNHNIAKLDVQPGRLYTANVSNFKVEYQFTSRMFFRTNLQWIDYRRNTDLYSYEVDPNSNKFFTQLLFSYKINPRTVFFLGYSGNYQNRNYRDDRRIVDDSLIQTNRAIFTKIGYAFMM